MIRELIESCAPHSEWVRGTLVISMRYRNQITRSS